MISWFWPEKLQVESRIHYPDPLLVDPLAVEIGRGSRGVRHEQGCLFHDFSYADGVRNQCLYRMVRNGLPYTRHDRDTGFRCDSTHVIRQKRIQFDSIRSLNISYVFFHMV